MGFLLISICNHYFALCTYKKNNYNPKLKNNSHRTKKKYVIFLQLYCKKCKSFAYLQTSKTQDDSRKIKNSKKTKRVFPGKNGKNPIYRSIKLLKKRAR